MGKGLLPQIMRFGDGQKKFLTSQVIASVYNNIVTGTFMTGLLLFIGIEPSSVGVFMSISLLANVFQIALGKIWDSFRHYEKTINRMILFTRLGILSVVLIPAVMRDYGTEVKTVMTGVILLFSYTFAASVGIHLNYWMVNAVPAEKQGVFFAFRDRIVVGATLVISVAASLLTDHLRERDEEYLGFIFAFFVAALLAAADYMVIRRIVYKRDAERRKKFKGITYRQILKKDRRFLKFVAFMFFLNLALNLANPYYNSYMLEHLKLKYIAVTGLTALQVLIQMAVSSVWAEIAGCFRWSRILNVVVLILGVQFWIWALVTPGSLWVIFVIFISSGLISTGLVTGQFMAVYEYIDHQNAMPYLSLCTCVSALGGFAGSLLGSRIIAAFEKSVWKLGNLEIDSMQLNMVISGTALLGTAVYAWLALRDKK